MSVLVHLYQRQTDKAINKLSEERTIFKHNALHDTLTGIPNRRYFYQYVNNAITAATSSKKKLVLFYFDIDKFKHINDHYGHAAGDELLKAFATRMSDRVQDDDLAARLSGDEFAALVNLSNGSLEFYEQRLRSICESPFNLGGIEHQVGMSLGYAAYLDDGKSLDELLRAADERMYKDKSLRKAKERASANNIIELPRQFGT